MTTRVKITNEGPEYLSVRYYNEQRQFTEQRDILKPGESVTVDVWNGKLPVLWPFDPRAVETDGDAKFYACPPATMSPRYW